MASSPAPVTTIPATSSTPNLPAYLAVPAGTDPGTGTGARNPGVVVVHDAFGLTDDMRAQADWLASAGYVTVVPDLYSRGGMLRCIRSVARSLMSGQGQVFDEVEATRGWLAARPDCTGVTGVIGYCMGGGFALLLAPRPGWSAASVNYGQVPKEAERVLAGACPVVGSYGGSDRAMRGAAAKLERALTANGVEHDVHEYPGAGHAFMNRPDQNAVLSVLGKVLGLGYDGPATDDARRRIEAFFGEHLRSS